MKITDSETYSVVYCIPLLKNYPENRPLREISLVLKININACINYNYEIIGRNNLDKIIQLSSHNLK